MEDCWDLVIHAIVSVAKKPYDEFISKLPRTEILQYKPLKQILKREEKKMSHYYQFDPICRIY
jgi:hypothetical protein